MALPSSTRVVLALLAAFLIASIHVQADSLWLDEGYSVAIVHDGDAPQNMRAVPTFVMSSLRDALSRSRADVHPPLYFLLLDAWTLIAGESVFALRLLSVFCGMLGLAATYALGRRLFDWRVGLAALLILATAGMFVYYNRETRMYTLLLALAALSMLAYLRCLARPTSSRAMVYGGLLALLLYTHYAGALILLTQALHLLLSRPRRVLHWLGPLSLALLLYAPWIPVILSQWRTYGQPGAPNFNDTGVALAALVYALTAGYAALYLIPALGLPLAVRQHGWVILLPGLWLIVTPLALLLGNHLIPSLFQPRYTLAILPAAALLTAAGLAVLTQRAGRYGTVLYLGLLGAILYTQLTTYAYVWPAKPRWDEAVQQVAAARNPLDPALSIVPEHSPAAYYGRLYGLRQGITLDLGWRWQEPDNMAAYVEKLDTAESVWLMMPSSTVSTWDAAWDLLPDRHVGYRDSVMDMLFYRFDAGLGDGLRFQFGDALAYNADIGQELYAVPGEDFCFTLDLEVLRASDHLYRVSFALTQGYDTIRVQFSRDVNLPAAGKTLHLDPCVPLPRGNPTGPHHLRLQIIDTTDAQTLPLLEDETLYWGETLVFALVHVGG